MIAKEENKINLLIILIYLSYFVGFFLSENSIGSGGYNSDFQFRVDINKNVESLNISNTVAIVCHHINHILKKKNL